MDHDTVFWRMTPAEIDEANVAYDMLLDAREKMKKGG